MEWIRVEDDLPKLLLGDEICRLSVPVFAVDRFGHAGVSCWSEGGYGGFWQTSDMAMDCDAVIAWMPIPGIG